MTAPVVPRKEARQSIVDAFNIAFGVECGSTAPLCMEFEAIVRAAEAAERERCAKRCEDAVRLYGVINLDVSDEHRAKDYQRERASLACAAAIRAMGGK